MAATTILKFSLLAINQSLLIMAIKTGHLHSYSDSVKRRYRVLHWIWLKFCSHGLQETELLTR